MGLADIIVGMAIWIYLVINTNLTTFIFSKNSSMIIDTRSNILHLFYVFVKTILKDY